MKTIILSFKGRHEPEFIGAYTIVENAKWGAPAHCGDPNSPCLNDFQSTYIRIIEYQLDADWNLGINRAELHLGRIINEWVKEQGTIRWTHRSFQ